MAGVKIDPRHFGCVYNSACCFYYDGKYRNARKWFELALKLKPHSQDALVGKTICCLKLGRHDEAHGTMQKLS